MAIYLVVAHLRPDAPGHPVLRRDRAFLRNACRDRRRPRALRNREDRPDPASGPADPARTRSRRGGLDNRWRLGGGRLGIAGSSTLARGLRVVRGARDRRSSPGPPCRLRGVGGVLRLLVCWHRRAYTRRGCDPGRRGRRSSRGGGFGRAGLEFQRKENDGTRAWTG